MAEVWFDLVWFGLVGFGLTPLNIYRLQLLSLEVIPGLFAGQIPGCPIVPVLIYQSGVSPLLSMCITTRNAHYLR